MLTINVGLLGHVDSGKTSLAKALSHIASTAAFDKNPQSRDRGITLDLGFSAREIVRSSSDEDANGADVSNATMRSSDSAAAAAACDALLARAGLQKVVCTFVDCPGHASLLRTIVGGAQIIDVMVLVIDASKGVQAQTAECMVLGEVLAKPLLVVVNKIDALACGDDGSNTNNNKDSRGSADMTASAALTRLHRKLRATFAKTRWPRVTIVDVAAAPRVRGDYAEQSQQQQQSQQQSTTARVDVAAAAAPPVNTEAVLPALLSLLDLRALHTRRAASREGSAACALPRACDFHMLVDHCFAVRGQGSVLTGTVLDGVVRVGDAVLLPEQQLVRKVKGLQMFRQPVQEARRGDRIGLCVTQFDAASMERGLLCSAVSDDEGEGESSADNHKAKKAMHVDEDSDDGTAADTKKKSSNSRATMVQQQQSDDAQRRAAQLRALQAALRTRGAAATAVLIAEVLRVRYHAFACNTQTKYHVMVGHAACMATARFFRRRRRPHRADGEAALDVTHESEYVDELGEDACMHFDTQATHTGDDDADALPPGQPAPLLHNEYTYYAVWLLERPLFARVASPLLALRLDLEREGVCRIAMAGRICALLPTSTTSTGTATTVAMTHSSSHDATAETASALWRALPVVRTRRRVLRVERVVDARTCIASGVVGVAVGGDKVSHGSDNVEQHTSSGRRAGDDAMAAARGTTSAMLHAQVQRFLGMRVQFVAHESTDDGNNNNGSSSNTNDDAGSQVTCVDGVIDSAFGHTGKVKLVFVRDVFVLPSSAHHRGKGGNEGSTGSSTGSSSNTSTTRNKRASHSAASRADKDDKDDDEDDANKTSSCFCTPGEIVLELKKYPYALHSTLTQ